MDIGLVKNKKRQEGERAIRHNRPIQRDANTSHSIAPKNIPNPEALQAKASPAIAARKYAKPRHDQSQKVPAGAEQISQASSSSLSTARQNNGPAISVQRGRQQDHSSYQRHSMPKNDYQGSQGSYSYQHHQNQYPGFANFTNRMPGFALSSGRQQRPPKEEAYKLAGSDGVLDPEAYKNFKPPTAHKTSTTRRTVRNPFYVTRPSHVGDPSVYTQEGLQFAQCLFNGIHDTLQPKEKARHEEWIQNHVKRWKYCPSSKPWERVPGTPGGNPSRPEIMPGGYWCRCPERKHLVTDELIGAGQGGYWLWDGEWLGPYWNDDRGLKTWQKVFKGKPGMYCSSHSSLHIIL